MRRQLDNWCTGTNKRWEEGVKLELMWKVGAVELQEVWELDPSPYRIASHFFLTYLPTVNHSKGRLYKKHWKIIIPSYLKMNVLEWVCNYFFWTREIGKKHLFSLCALKIWCPCWLPSKERREKMSLKEKKLATLVELNTIIVKTQYSLYK